MSSPVLFADTFYWVAVLSPRDPFHARVMAWGRNLSAIRLITTDEVLTEVLNNMRASVERRPRAIWLIYSVPREQHIIEQSGLFNRSELYVIVGSEYRVYSHDPAPPAVRV